mmetsp:Transcript_2579/g.4927  ORF Transcript_2579/g.4927 Transcript_2579/m.4927 type:complete len:82 (-) Transcript_2579:2333-2578(-)
MRKKASKSGYDSENFHPNENEFQAMKKVSKKTTDGIPTLRPFPPSSSSCQEKKSMVRFQFSRSVSDASEYLEIQEIISNLQ